MTVCCDCLIQHIWTGFMVTRSYTIILLIDACYDCISVICFWKFEISLITFLHTVNRQPKILKFADICKTYEWMHIKQQQQQTDKQTNFGSLNFSTIPNLNRLQFFFSENILRYNISITSHITSLWYNNIASYDMITLPDACLELKHLLFQATIYLS